MTYTLVTLHIVQAYYVICHYKYATVVCHRFGFVVVD